jgi:hypothetical protein
MCCFFIALFTLGPRFAFLVYWLIQPGMVSLAFDTYIVPILGLIFLPWTTLMVAIVSGVNGVIGWDWLWVGLALACDIATYAYGGYRRKEVPYYPEQLP